MKLKNIAAVLLSALLFASVGSFAACSGNGNSAPDGSQSNSDNGSNSDTLSNGSSAPSSETPDDKDTDTAVKSLSSTSYNFDAEYYYDDYNTLSEGSSLQNYSTTFENKEIVFQAVTWEELVYLFEQEGNYLILFGGSWCPNTRASAPYINDYAKEYGITTIYNFDFRLDGENSSSHIRVSDGDSGLAAGYNYLYGELVSRYITNLNDWVEYKEGSKSSLTYTNSDGAEVNVAKVQVPFLFLYNKDNTKHYKPVYDENGKQTGAEEDTSATGNYPIVYGFEEMIQKDDQGVYEGSNYNRETGAYDNKTYFTEEYKARLKNVFEYIKTNNVALSSFTDADYIRTAYNQKAGVELFAANDKINYNVVTYRQLVWLLEQEGSSAILLGGSWCGNTHAAIQTVNDYAVANDLTVYNFDTKLDGGYAKKYWNYSSDAHIRDSANPLVRLYTDLIEKYFTNIQTEYDVNSEKASQYISYTDGENTVKVNKLQVPFLIAYNKDGKDQDGFSAPILASFEKMFTLSESKSSYVFTAENYATYKAGTYSVISAYQQSVNKPATEITVNRAA